MISSDNIYILSKLSLFVKLNFDFFLVVKALTAWNNDIYLTEKTLTGQVVFLFFWI